MAGFQELAKQFVQSDNTVFKQSLAKQAAEQLQTAPDGKTAIASWISSVQHWVAFQGDQDDLVARSNAYLFLADTIECLQTDFLMPDTAGLLVRYFKSMFEGDVRGGVRGAVKALSRLVDQKAFKLTDGDEILSSLKKLDADFKLQDGETRAAIYDLIKKIITRPDIAEMLQFQHQATAGFMTDLVQLTGSERDPRCLHTWFGILRFFLAEYKPSDDVVKVIFDQFSGYFPISLKSSQHPSGLTTEDMKESLRGCFTAHYSLANLAIPFLLKRLNEGDGVRVNIKLDMLETLNACMVNYGHVAKSIAPYVDDVWTNLKYEVRNGDVEESIDATLIVICNMARRLEGSQLVDFLLTVQRDCLEDLSNPSYTPQVGRLLLSVLGAGAEPFAIMVSPVINEIKQGIRQPKSQKHTASLLTLSNKILELRSVLFERAQSTAESSIAFKATDAIFNALLHDTYMRQYSAKVDNPQDADSISVSSELIKGFGLFMAQKTCPTYGQQPEPLIGLLDIESLFLALLPTWTLLRSDDSNSDKAGVITTSVVDSLRSGVVAHRGTVQGLINEIRKSENINGVKRIQVLNSMVQDLAYITCSKISGFDDGCVNYVAVHNFLLASFKEICDNQEGSKPFPTAEIIIRGFITALHHFEAACKDFLGHEFIRELSRAELNALPDDQRFNWADWVPYIRKRCDYLITIQDESQVEFAEETGEEGRPEPTRQPGDLPDSEDREEQLLVDFHLLNLYSVRQLYRKVTVATRGADRSSLTMELAPFFKTNTSLREQRAEDVLLMRIRAYAEAVISRLHEKQQRDLFLADEVITLFHGNEKFQSPRQPHERSDHNAVGHQVREAIIAPPPTRGARVIEGTQNLRNPPSFPITDKNQGRTYILSAGILTALRSEKDSGRAEPLGYLGAFAPWLHSQMAEQFLIAGLIARDAAPIYERSESFVLVMLTSLGNKFEVEKMPGVVKVILSQLKLLTSGTWLQKDEKYTTFKEQLNEKTARTTCDDETYVNVEWRLVLARRVLAVLAGILPRLKISGLDAEARQMFEHLKLLPAAPQAGPRLARYMEILFNQDELLKKECHPCQKKLWRQMSFSMWVESMLENVLPVRNRVDDAKDSDTEIPDADVAEAANKKKLDAASYSIAVIHIISHMDFAIWQEQMPKILPMLLSVLGEFPHGHDVDRALAVLSTIALKSPESVREHVDSIVKHCYTALSNARSPRNFAVPAWMPDDFKQADEYTANKFNGRKIAIDILHTLATTQDKAKIHSKFQIRRELKEVLGDPVREVRRAAQVTLPLWSEN